MAVRSTNTMSEGLQSLIQDIATMKTMPDADIPWLIQLETEILQKMREPIDKLQGGDGPPPNAVPGGQGPIPGGHGMNMAGAAGPGAAGPPGAPMQPGGDPQTGLSDEIRRIVQQ